MNIGTTIYITEISQSLLDEEANYTDPDYPNISDILNQIISQNSELTITRKDENGTFYFDYLFTDKNNEQLLYVLTLDNSLKWKENRK